MHKIPVRSFFARSCAGQGERTTSRRAQCDVIAVVATHCARAVDRIGAVRRATCAFVWPPGVDALFSDDGKSRSGWRAREETVRLVRLV